MTREQEEYVGKLIEAHVGKVDAIARELRKKWPEEKIGVKDIQYARRKYIIFRLGTSQYADRRLTAYQIYESGGSVDDVILELGTTAKKATDYLRDWKMQRDGWKENKKRTGASGKEGRLHVPGGAVFGKETSRDSIWRA